MSGQIQLGTVPQLLSVILSPGFPFVTVLRRTTGAWSAAPVMTFSDNSTWTGTTSGTDATFGVESAEVDTILALTDSRVILTVGGVLWAQGNWSSR